MSWKKEVGTDDSRSYEYILIALIVFFIIGVIYKSPIVFIGVGIFIAFLLAYKIYDRSVVRSLALKNNQTTIKLFPEEQETLRFDMENQSIFPLINGQLTFQLGSAIKAYTLTNQEDYWKELNVPISLVQKKKNRIEIPIRAEQRGVAKVQKISYSFPHLLNFNMLRLRYTDYYRTEVIVYPKLLPVQGIEAVYHMMQGESRLNHSPYEDILSPLGTRDYSYSDPFHKINWKATVKTQKLQTNIYEKVVDQSFVFIVNLGSAEMNSMMSFNPNLEKLLSYAAYLSEYSTKMGIPFELFINTRKPGKTPYMHLHEGEGKVHYMHALEMLARVHKQSPILPFNSLLYQIGKQFIKPKTIIFIGDIPRGATGILHSWKQGQQSVFQVVENEAGSIIKPMLVRERVEDAT